MFWAAGGLDDGVIVDPERLPRRVSAEAPTIRSTCCTGGGWVFFGGEGRREGVVVSLQLAPHGMFLLFLQRSRSKSCAVWWCNCRRCVRLFLHGGGDWRRGKRRGRISFATTPQKTHHGEGTSACIHRMEEGRVRSSRLDAVGCRSAFVRSMCCFALACLTSTHPLTRPMYTISFYGF